MLIFLIVLLLLLLTWLFIMGADERTLEEKLTISEQEKKDWHEQFSK